MKDTFDKMDDDQKLQTILVALFSAALLTRENGHLQDADSIVNRAAKVADEVIKYCKNGI